MEEFDELESYKLAFEYLVRAINMTQQKLDKLGNTEYEQGKIDGLVVSLNIVKKALEVYDLK
jgi:hypothetical protein